MQFAQIQFQMLLRVIQSVILKGEFEGGSRKLASGTSGREMGWQRIKSENSGGRTSKKKGKKQAQKLDQSLIIFIFRITGLLLHHIIGNSHQGNRVGQGQLRGR